MSTHDVHAPLATIVTTLLPGKKVKEMQDSSTKLSLGVYPGEGSGTLVLGMQPGLKERVPSSKSRAAYTQPSTHTEVSAHSPCTEHSH